MTAPACNPATLRAAPCGGCRRTMHTPSGSRPHQPKGMCDRGHPIHDGLGMCPGCRTRARRAAAGRPTLRVKQRTPRSPNAYAYCTHDEGERCDCEAAS